MAYRERRERQLHAVGREALELAILAHVARGHTFDPLGAQQQAEPPAVDTAIVRDLDVTPGGLYLVETAPGITADHVRAVTAAELLRK